MAREAEDLEGRQRRWNARVLMGLVVARPRPGGGYLWRLADVPPGVPRPALVAPVVGGRR